MDAGRFAAGRGLAARIREVTGRADHDHTIRLLALPTGQPRHPQAPDGSLPESWLLPIDTPEPADYWVSTLPAGIRLRGLARCPRSAAHQARLPRTRRRLPPGHAVHRQPLTVSASSIRGIRNQSRCSAQCRLGLRFFASRDRYCVPCGKQHVLKPRQRLVVGVRV